jgi:hypothetical protein
MLAIAPMTMRECPALARQINRYQEDAADVN